jgi:hypothetical protein
MYRNYYYIRVLQEHILLATDVFKVNTINENKILVNDIP